MEAGLQGDQLVRAAVARFRRSAGQILGPHLARGAASALRRAQSDWLQILEADRRRLAQSSKMERLRGRRRRYAGEDQYERFPLDADRRQRQVLGPDEGAVATGEDFVH